MIGIIFRVKGGTFRKFKIHGNQETKQETLSSAILDLAGQRETQGRFLG